MTLWKTSEAEPGPVPGGVVRSRDFNLAGDRPRHRIGVTLVLALALSGAAPPADTAAMQSIVKAPALFQRAEPHLSAGARALEKGDVDGALEHYKKAAPETDDERAIIEYDVGAALLVRAMLAAAPPGAPQGGTPSQHAPSGAQDPTPTDGAPAGPDAAAIDDANAAFDRAFGIAKDRRLKSEAALAAGNANAMGGKLDEAIAHYRKAMVADPSNARAKVNLKRALEAKRAQPPPPPQPEDGEGDKKDGDDKKDGKGDDKKVPEENPGDKPSDEKKPEEKPEAKPEEKPGDAAAQKKKMKKDEARRMLEMMRSRERPLTPMEMRGQQKVQKPKNGKDW